MSDAEIAQDGAPPAAPIYAATTLAATPGVPDSILLRHWWALGVISATYMFAFMDRMSLAILLQPIKIELHLSDQQLGLLSGIAFAFFYCTFGIPLARIADRHSRVRLISICTAMWSVAMILCGQARNFPQLFLARMGIGIGEAGCVPPAHSLIGDYFPGKRRALAISIYQAGAVIGVAGGMALVGALGQHLGWRLSLTIVGAAGFPLALLAHLTITEPSRQKLAKCDQENVWAVLSALLRRKAFLHLALGNSLSSICTYGITQWTPTFLIRSFGMGLTEVGGWTGLAVGTSGILGLITGGLLITKLLPRDVRWELWLPTIAYSVSLPLYVLMFFSPTAAWAILLKTLGYFGAAVAGGVAFSSVQSFAEPHRRATAVAIVLFLMTMLGMGLGPYLIGVMSDLLAPRFGVESLRYALLLSTVMLAWAIFHFAMAARHCIADRVQ